MNYFRKKEFLDDLALKALLIYLNVPEKR